MSGLALFISKSQLEWRGKKNIGSLPRRRAGGGVWRRMRRGCLSAQGWRMGWLVAEVQRCGPGQGPGA